MKIELKNCYCRNCNSNIFYANINGRNKGFYCVDCNTKLENITDTYNIDVKYVNKAVNPIYKNEKGDWLDLRSRVTIEIKKGECKLVPLGVCIKLPEHCTGILAPRSSLFKYHKVIMTNGIGIIDESYCGEDDEWMISLYATEDTIIEQNEKIAQFRIIDKMPEVEINTVEHMTAPNRKGFGSTGKF